VEHAAYFTHGYHVWEAIMRVPLLIRRPDLPGRRVAVPVSLVDLAPTLLDAVGYPVPKDLDGVPVSQRGPRDSLSMEASGWQNIQSRALLRGRDKWFVTLDTEGQIIDRWYLDLQRDPEELSRSMWPLSKGEPDALLSWINSDPDPGGVPRELHRGTPLTHPKVAPGVSERDLEALRSLGYVE
jgi:arylsulfatase A-like enzyme